MSIKDYVSWFLSQTVKFEYGGTQTYQLDTVPLARTGQPSFSHRSPPSSSLDVVWCRLPTRPFERLMIQIYGDLPIYTFFLVVEDPVVHINYRTCCQHFSKYLSKLTIVNLGRRDSRCSLKCHSKFTLQVSKASFVQFNESRFDLF